jgi:hypothetical protein
MKTGRLLRIVLSVFLLAAMILSFSLLESLTEWKDPSESRKAMEKDSYNGAGLPDGQSLSDDLLFEDNGLLCYPDRLFRRFAYTDGQIAEFGKYLEKLEDGTDIAVYVVPVPPRVTVEKAGDRDRTEYAAFLQKMQAAFPGKAKLIDVLPAMRQHQEEYIYFRTEEAWTARGAAYGTGELLNSLTGDTVSLSSYYEYMFNAFSGSLVQDSLNLYADDSRYLPYLESIPKDLKYFYTYPGSAQMEEICSEEGEEEESVVRKQPLVSIEDSGIGSFVGSSYLYADVRDLERKTAPQQETLLVLADPCGNLAIPFLAAEYERVFVVSLSESEYLAENYSGIINKYGIRNVVLIQSAGHMGDTAYNAALNGMLTQS